MLVGFFSSLFYTVLNTLPFFFSKFPGMKSVGNRVGVSEPFLMRMAHGAPMRTLNRSTNNTKRLHGKFESQAGVTNKSAISNEHTHRVCKRFYVALILSRLVQVSCLCFFFPFLFFKLINVEYSQLNAV